MADFNCMIRYMLETKKGSKSDRQNLLNAFIANITAESLRTEEHDIKSIIWLLNEDDDKSNDSSTEDVLWEALVQLRVDASKVNTLAMPILNRILVKANELSCSIPIPWYTRILNRDPGEANKLSCSIPIHWYTYSVVSYFIINVFLLIKIPPP